MIGSVSSQVHYERINTNCKLLLLLLEFYHRGRYFSDSTVNSCKPRGPQHTYYFIVVIIVAENKMQEREMKYTFN